MAPIEPGKINENVIEAKVLNGEREHKKRIPTCKQSTNFSFNYISD